MGTRLVYDGSAKDHFDTPQVFEKDKDGNVLKSKGRAVIRVPSKRTFTPIETYKLWGVEFPKGEEVEIEDKKLVKKALALGCFKAVTVPVEVVVETAPAAEPETQETPHASPWQARRRGRPRKEATE